MSYPFSSHVHFSSHLCHFLSSQFCNIQQNKYEDFVWLKNIFKRVNLNWFKIKKLFKKLSYLYKKKDNKI